ncbi:MAG TPA: hypothetical protein VGI69_00480 [Gaiellaceae bacterium]|jgi:hypothetical protein
MKIVREAKDKRAKKLAIGGAVLLVAVLAFEIPHVMKKSGGSSNSAAPATTTTAAGTSAAPASSATTATGTATAATLPATSTKLPNSDVAPTRLKSQLLAFSEFASKDPFVQQVSAADITSSPSSGSSSGASAGGSGGGGSSSFTAPAQQTASRTLAQAGAVTLQVNGKVQTVRVGASFPTSNPLFKLVAVTHGGVRIGIANGSYATGAQTVTLGAGRSLTLVDTADGVRYKVTLVS